MSENGFLIFHRFFRLSIALLHTAGLTLFIKPYLMDKKHLRRKLLLVFSLHLAVWLSCSRIAAAQSIFIPVFTVLLLAVSKILELKTAFTFLLAILYCNVRILSGLIAESLYHAAEALLPFYSEIPEDIYLHSAAETLWFALTHFVLLSGMLYALCRQLRKRTITLHWQELCYLCLIPSAGILFGQIISRLLFEISDGIPLSLYERHPAFLIAVPLLALLFYTGTLFTVVFQQGVETLRREREDYFVNLQQTRMIQDRLRETDLFYTHLRQMKHELRGHLNNIKGLSQSGQYKDLEQYIARMDKTICDFELAIPTGNAVTDVIVNDKRAQCLRLDIDFQADFHYPISGQYDAFDLGIILQNLLLNAIEACEKAEGKEKYIYLTGRQKGNFFLIRVINPFTGEIHFRSDGLPITTKEKDIPLHGIGLSNVRREAEKYMGELELKTTNHEFSATVLLQERSNL